MKGKQRIPINMLARTIEKYLIFISDALSLNLAFTGIFWLRYRSGFFAQHFDTTRSFSHYSQIAFVLSLIWIAYFYLTGLYRDWYLESRTAQILVVTKRITSGVLVILALTSGPDVIHALHTHDYLAPFTRTRIASISAYWLIFILLVNGFRLLVQSVMRLLMYKGIGLDRMLILGANESGLIIQKEFESSPTLGWKVWGFLDEMAASLGQKFGDHAILGKYSDLPDIVKREKIGGIVISHESHSHNEIIRILALVAEYPLSVFIVPDLYDVVTGHFKTSAVHGCALKVLFPEHMPAWEAKIKRLIDIIFSLVFLSLASPFLLFIALFIKLDSRGPVFYSQERIGQYGKRFWVHKFRSMRTDAEAAGPQWATQRDPRVTRLGLFLRNTRIDEIPQLWCVLKGDMSLVGPRPEREHFINQLRHEVPLYLKRLKMKPGLTGWAQVKHKYDSSIDDVKTKVTYDLWYFENMSVALDIQILIRTIWVVISGHGAH